MRALVTRVLVIFAITGFVLAGAVHSSPSIPQKSFIEGVPYTPQLPNYCGPASLSSLLAHWGVSVSQKDIGQGICDGSELGTSAGDLLLFCRDKGLSAYSFNGTIDELKEDISKGYPVLVLQYFSKSVKLGHYRVAVGYDDSERVIILRDSNKPDLIRLPYSEFEYLWSKEGSWAMIVMTKDKDIFSETLGKTNPVVHLDLAVAYLHKKDFDKAAKESLVTLGIEPSNPYALEMLKQSKGKT